jgi:hypothetical protein
MSITYITICIPFFSICIHWFFKFNLPNLVADGRLLEWDVLVLTALEDLLVDAVEADGVRVRLPGVDLKNQSKLKWIFLLQTTSRSRGTK